MSDLQCPTTLILARHGEAEYETSEWADEGGSLTGLGRDQARHLGESLVGHRIAHIWTSSLARAVQTAEIAAARLDVSATTRLGLHEFGAGDFATEPRQVDPFMKIYTAWLAGDLEPRVPGGESGLEIVARLRGVLAEIADAHRGETVLVVSHGGILRLGVPALCRMDVPAGDTPNCFTVEIEIDNDDWVCRRWGHESTPKS